MCGTAGPSLLPSVTGAGRTQHRAVVGLFDVLGELDDSELTRIVATVTEEQQQRALHRGDLAALLADGFENGFARNGSALDPYLHDTVLVCPGSVIDKSATSHDCTFVHIGDSWVWECEPLLVDEVRTSPITGTRMLQRSVSLVAAVEGLEFDVVSSKMRTGAHKMVASRSYLIRGGAIELVAARNVARTPPR